MDMAGPVGILTAGAASATGSDFFMIAKAQDRHKMLSSASTEHAAQMPFPQLLHTATLATFGCR
jgi:hypothetical protein